jgi:hypothetical protein
MQNCGLSFYIYDPRSIELPRKRVGAEGDQSYCVLNVVDACGNAGCCGQGSKAEAATPGGRHRSGGRGPRPDRKAGGGGLAAGDLPRGHGRGTAVALRRAQGAPSVR